MSTITFPLTERVKTHFLGTRYTARPLRQELENMLAEHYEVTLDFSAMSVTQSFIDELMGALILKNGPDLMKRMSFKGCSNDVKEIIRFVIGSRSKDYIQTHHH